MLNNAGVFSAPSHRGETYRRFHEEFGDAMLAADLEMLVGDQCMHYLPYLCRWALLPRPRANVSIAAHWPALERLGSLGRIIHYYDTIEEWLDLLAELVSAPNPSDAHTHTSHPAKCAR